MNRNMISWVVSLLVSIFYVLDANGTILKTFIHTHNQVIAQHVGDYPVILMVIDANDWSVDKSYFHANGQTLMQQAGENKYFYLHDRLGSTRQVIDTSASVVNSYTYDPWGNAFSTETSETVSNHYQFANYHWDGTVGMYYLNARWYDPVVLRFTGRDPVNGKFNEPLTLHKYLYCLNNPTNRIDPDGQFSFSSAVSKKLV